MSKKNKLFKTAAATAAPKSNMRIIDGVEVNIGTGYGRYLYTKARAEHPERFKDDDDSKLGMSTMSDPAKHEYQLNYAGTRLGAIVQAQKKIEAAEKVGDLSGTIPTPDHKVPSDSEFGEDEPKEGEENPEGEKAEKKEDEVKETVEIAKDEIEKLGELVVNIDDILSNINQQVEEITNPEVEENLDMAEQAQNGEMPEEPKVEASKVKAARKIIHVDPEIESTKSGWYVVTYSCDDGDGNGEYYEHKKFDDKKEAKEAIKELQKQIGKVEARLKVKADDLPDNPVEAYLVTALWAEGGGNPEVENKSIYDFSPASKAMAEKDVKKLLDNPIVQKVLDRGGVSEASMASDLWLSRNGHGTGFFDRDYPEAKELQKFAKEFKSLDIEVGDDGLVRFFPEEGKTEARKVKAESDWSGYRITFPQPKEDGQEFVNNFSDKYPNAKISDWGDTTEGKFYIDVIFKGSEEDQKSAADQIKKDKTLKIATMEKYNLSSQASRKIRAGNGIAGVMHNLGWFKMTLDEAFNELNEQFAYGHGFSGEDEKKYDIMYHLFYDLKAAARPFLKQISEKLQEWNEGKVDASRKVNADAEPTATEPLTEEHTSAILDYIADNPQVSDADFHEFVEGLGVDIHEAETLIYRTLSEMMKDEKQEEAEGQDESHLEAEASKKKVDRQSRWAKVQAELKEIKAGNYGKPPFSGEPWDRDKTPYDQKKYNIGDIVEVIGEDGLGLVVKIDDSDQLTGFRYYIVYKSHSGKVESERANYITTPDNSDGSLDAEYEKLKTAAKENGFKIKAGKVKAEITEADETATSKEKAIANFEHQVKLYRKGDETMGVVDMYERAARKMGATDAEISAIWKKHKKVEAANGDTRGKRNPSETPGVRKIEVTEDRMGNILAKNANDPKQNIFIQAEDAKEQFKQDISFLAGDEGYQKESDMTKEDAWEEVSKGWSILFTIGQDMWNDYLNVFGEGKVEAQKVEADTVKDYQPGQKVKVNLNGKDVDGTVEKSNPTDNTVEVKPVMPGAAPTTTPISTDPTQPKPLGTETVKVQMSPEQKQPIKKAMLNRVKAREVKAMDDMGNPYIPEKDAQIYVDHILDKIKTANKVTWQIGNSGTQVRGEEKYGAPYFHIDVDDISMLQITIDPKKQEAELSVEDPSRNGRRINLVIEIADIETADYSKIGQAIDGNIAKHSEANE